MQVSIDIQDDLHEKVLSNEIDMQYAFNQYLRHQVEEDAYHSSQQYQEDRAYFQAIHNDIKKGEIELIPLDEDMGIKKFRENI